MFWFPLVAWSAEPSLRDAQCTCFAGEARGNDRVAAGFRLCREGAALTGAFDWTGERSGRSFRILEGSVAGDTITLRDVAMPSDHPTSGWRFCAIDRYALRLGPNGDLTGTYDSAACRDHADISLHPAECPASAPVVRGPRRELVPDEVQACRDRGLMWLSDPDYYERTEIHQGADWTPVWQVRDRQGGRLGYLLVYPGSCRVVVGIPSEAGGNLQVSTPDNAPATPAEAEMLRRWIP